MHLYFLPQVQAIQEESARLQGAYAGNKAKEIKDQEQEVLDAWRNLHMKVESRRTTLANASDLYRFFNMVRDLLLWMDDIIRQTNTQEKPRYCLMIYFNNYTPGIYADGYIAFAFPFVPSSVRMLVS